MLIDYEIKRETQFRQKITILSHFSPVFQRKSQFSRIQDILEIFFDSFFYYSVHLREISLFCPSILFLSSLEPSLTQIIDEGKKNQRSSESY